MPFLMRFKRQCGRDIMQTKLNHPNRSDKGSVFLFRAHNVACVALIRVGMLGMLHRDVRDVTSQTDQEKTRHSARRKPYIGAENRTFQAANRTFNLVILTYNYIILHRFDGYDTQLLHIFNAENCSKSHFFKPSCVQSYNR